MSIEDQDPQTGVLGAEYMDCFAERAVRTLTAMNPDHAADTMRRLDDDREHWRLRCMAADDEIQHLRTELARSNTEILDLRRHLLTLQTELQRFEEAV